MNLDELLADPVIAKRVYEKYPAKKKEKSCAAEKARLDGLRVELAKRIINGEGKEKMEYK